MLPRVFTCAMEKREEFLNWFSTQWRQAEDLLHSGDASGRFETRADHAPLTLFGAWMEALDPEAVHRVFRPLESSFSHRISSGIELLAMDVSGNMAYTVHRETTSTHVDGERRDYALRVTQVYRRENGEWKVVHRHADTAPR